MKRKPKKASSANVPSPAELMAKAEALPRKVTLSNYLPVMWKLKTEKGLSLREIATWLSQELSVPVTHMQVYRAMEASIPPPEQVSTVQQAEENENRRDELQEEAES